MTRRAVRHPDRTGPRAARTPPVQRRAGGPAGRPARPSTGGGNWYLDPTGRNSTLWPDYSWSYWLRMRHFDPTAYRVDGAVRPARAPVNPPHANARSGIEEQR